MKSHILSIAWGILTALSATAQEYKVAKNTGELQISEVNHIIIEGTSGNEIIFTGRGNERDDDERAKGLRAISGMGLEDNTGLGLSVTDHGNSVVVQQLKKMDGPSITVKVPKGVKVLYEHMSPHGDDVEFRNFDGQITVQTVHSSIKLNNVGGAIDIRTVHGDVDASLPNPSKSISILSNHGHVDVALPVGTKANLSLSTQFGEILLDPDFKIEIEKVDDMVRYGNKLNGKLNGGGEASITLISQHNNVYLRKKV